MSPGNKKMSFVHVWSKMDFMSATPFFFFTNLLTLWPKGQKHLLVVCLNKSFHRFLVINEARLGYYSHWHGHLIIWDYHFNYCFQLQHNFIHNDHCNALNFNGFKAVVIEEIHCTCIAIIMILYTLFCLLFYQQLSFLDLLSSSCFHVFIFLSEKDI